MLELLERFRKIRIYKRGERRAPHKPLLILYALGQFQHSRTTFSYPEVADALIPLLDAYAPHVEGLHSPEEPYWRLRNDQGLWDVTNIDSAYYVAAKVPPIGALTPSTAGFSEEVLLALMRIESLSTLSQSSCCMTTSQVPSMKT